MVVCQARCDRFSFIEKLESDFLIRHFDGNRNRARACCCSLHARSRCSTLNESNLNQSRTTTYQLVEYNAARGAALGGCCIMASTRNHLFSSRLPLRVPAMSRSARALPAISQCAFVAMAASLFAPMKSCAMVPAAPALATRTASLCFRTRVRPLSALSACSSSPTASGDILNQVEATLSNVFAAYGISDGSTFGTADILTLPSHQREAVGVATNLQRRLEAVGRSNDCRTCWLQRKHCICSQCPPCETLPKINRLFLLTHHKEVGMIVDTAKLLLSTFPSKSRLVVAGIGREHQPSMGEMLDAVRGVNTNDLSKKCLVLFPSEDALTFAEIEEKAEVKASEDDNESNRDQQYDVVVIDGTWSQARKMYNRYIPSEEDGGPQRVQLSDDAVATLNGDGADSGTFWYDNEDNQRISGHQLRRHPTQWREVATCEATRLLLRDMMGDDNFTSSDENAVTPWDALVRYQNIANAAALRQIGPPRIATTDS